MTVKNCIKRRIEGENCFPLPRKQNWHLTILVRMFGLVFLHTCLFPVAASATCCPAAFPLFFRSKEHNPYFWRRNNDQWLWFSTLIIGIMWNKVHEIFWFSASSKLYWKLSYPGTENCFPWLYLFVWYFWVFFHMCLFSVAASATCSCVLLIFTDFNCHLI